MTIDINRRPPPNVPDGNQPWNSCRTAVIECLKWARANYSGIPGGFKDQDPTEIQAGVTATAGTLSQGWAAADHAHDVDTATPSHATGATAAAGTGSSLMRADATIAQGIVTTKGDVLTYSTTPARLAVGANGSYLTADSTAATGLAWATGLSPTDLEFLSWVL